MTALSRRAFLFAASATTLAVVMPSPARADGGKIDFTNYLNWSPAKRTQKINELAVSNYAKKNLPKKAMETKVQYKARMRNLVESLNTKAVYAQGSTRAAAQAAAATTEAAAAEAAGKKAMFGMMGGMGRLGWRMGARVLNWVALGSTLWYIGSALYNWLTGTSGTTDMSCAVGTTCKITANGKTTVQATTREYANAVSNWSLTGHNWSVRTQKRQAAGANGMPPGYYLVYWQWQEHNGYTSATFYPQLEFSPYQRGVGNTLLEQAVKDSGKLNSPLSRAEMADLLDQAIAGHVQSDPGLYPDGWAEGAKTNADPRPAVTAADFGDGGPAASATVTIGDYLADFASGISDAFDGLFDPVAVSDEIVSGIPDDGSTDENPAGPGGTPTPTPTPTPSTGGGTGTDWGTPPVGAMPGTPTPFSWMPTPWVAPDLPGSCAGVPYDFSAVLRNTRGVINPCPAINMARPVVRPVAILGWTGFAISQFLDL